MFFSDHNHRLSIDYPHNVHITMLPYLVGGWALPLWKLWKSIGMMTFPIEWKDRIHVPNHQPLLHFISHVTQVCIYIDIIPATPAQFCPISHLSLSMEAGQTSPCWLPTDNRLELQYTKMHFWSYKQDIAPINPPQTQLIHCLIKALPWRPCGPSGCCQCFGHPSQASWENVRICAVHSYDLPSGKLES